MPFFEDREHFFPWSAGRHFLAINRGWKATAVWLFPKLMAIALGGILAVYVYRWSRELFGPRGARLSLLLFAFSPTILGHTRLATPDILFATAAARRRPPEASRRRSQGR